MSQISDITDAVWNTVIDGYTALDLMRIIAAIAAGRKIIVDSGGGQIEMTFRTVSDDATVVDGDLLNYERTSVTITP